MRKSCSSSHGQFFNSLKQVEKRLKLETNKPPLTTVPPPDHQSNSDSLCSPMYILDEPLSNTNTIPQLLPSQDINHPQIAEKTQHETCNASNEIGLLMEQLGLSDSSKSSYMMGRFGLGCCDDVFYEKVVGVKGPKSGKELERMEGWIKFLLNDGGEVKEPFKLVHLLLAKAAFVHSVDGDDGFRGFEFPGTVSEFLRNDPPVVD